MLEVKNISKKFGNKKVLDNISLRVDPNQTIALVGRNGSGKSTLLKIYVVYWFLIQVKYLKI